MINFQASASNYANPSRAAAYNKAARQAARRMNLTDAVIQFFFDTNRRCIAFKIISNGHTVAVRYHDTLDRRGFYGAFKA